MAEATAMAPLSIRIGGWWLRLRGGLILATLTVASTSVVAAIVIVLASSCLGAASLMSRRGQSWRRRLSATGAVLYLLAPVDAVERVLLLGAGVGAAALIMSAAAIFAPRSNRARVAGCWLLGVAALTGIVAALAVARHVATGALSLGLVVAALVVAISDVVVILTLLYAAGSQGWASARPRRLGGDLVRLARGFRRGLLLIKPEDRPRGSGWLRCPRCEEQAIQDVVDRMRVLRVLLYRLTVIGRRRDLVCRRCGHRRRATQDELEALRSAGQPIRRAVLLPTGLIALAGAAGLIYIGFGGKPEVLTTNTISYIRVNESAEDVGPFSYEEPTGWNHDVLTSNGSGQRYVYVHETTPTGGIGFYIFREPGDPSVAQLIGEHYQDQRGLNSPDFPRDPPTTSCTMVAGQRAASYGIAFTVSGGPTQVIGYAFKRGAVGYVVYFVGRQQDAAGSIGPLAAHVITSFRFDGVEPAPSDPSSASASPSPLSGGPAATPARVAVSC